MHSHIYIYEEVVDMKERITNNNYRKKKMGAKGGTTLVCEHENYSVISMYKTETDEMTKK